MLLTWAFDSCVRQFNYGLQTYSGWQRREKNHHLESISGTKQCSNSLPVVPGQC